jgi:chemotaxis protein histidine kinase CheA
MIKVLLINRLRYFCRLLCVVLASLLALSAQALEKVYYRYVNEQGVTVLDSSIPPRYAQKGYQVVTISGKLVKDVPPAPSASDVGRVEAERQEAERVARWDARLLKRYSSVADIQAAKTRKLAELEGNLAILSGNLRNQKAQITELHAMAANHERAGRKVPASVIDNLAILESELVATEARIAKRQHEYDQTAARYDQDAERFAIIRPEAAR